MIRYVHNFAKYSFWCREEYEEILDNQIKESDILIVGLSWCPWTKRAKDLILKEYMIDPVILVPDIISNDYKIRFLHCLSKKVNTVYTPQIWIKGEYIGDFEQLYKMHHRNQIKL